MALSIGGRPANYRLGVPLKHTHTHTHTHTKHAWPSANRETIEREREREEIRVKMNTIESTMGSSKGEHCKQDDAR